MARHSREFYIMGDQLQDMCALLSISIVNLCFFSLSSSFGKDQGTTLQEQWCVAMHKHLATFSRFDCAMATLAEQKPWLLDADSGRKWQGREMWKIVVYDFAVYHRRKFRSQTSDNMDR